MSAKTLYRSAAILLLLFAAGHTVGFLKFKPPTLEGRAVLEAMTSVHFQVRGRDYSYGNFYRGFGLFNSVFLLFGAYLAWLLGDLASQNPRAASAAGWGLSLTMVASLVLCFRYFNLIAVTFSAVLAVCLGWAASLGRAETAGAPR
ncbi:MAG TPA: hypothetical protein VMV61_02310 [Patescibacteria group bacterium]|nr:hypothetical protein [Patescibacteria group bacterium]